MPRAVAGWTGSGFHLKPTELSGSVRVRIKPLLLFEGEVRYASATYSRAMTQGEYSQIGRPTSFVAKTTFFIDKSASQTSVAGNLLVPVGTALPTVSAFFGAGGGVRTTATQLETSLVCEPRVPTGCNGRPDVKGGQRGTSLAPIIQMNYGVDMILYPRLSGFAALRWPFELGSDSGDSAITGFGATVGVRLALGRTPFTAKQFASGERRPSRLRTGTLLGLIGGGMVGGLIAAESFSDDWRRVGPPMMTLLGTGVGAAIGAALDESARRHRP